MNLYVVFANLEEEHSIIYIQTKLEDEVAVMVTHQDAAGPSGTRSGKVYLKDYSKAGPKKSTKISRVPAK